MPDAGYQEMQQLMESIRNVRFSDPEQERVYCEELMALSAKRSYEYGVAFAHTYLGDYYLGMDSGMQCDHHLSHSRRLCKENGFDDLLLVNCILSGMQFDSLQDEQTALDYHLMGLNLARKLGNLGSMAMLYNNIGSEFNDLRDVVSAKKYFQMAYDLMQEPGVEISLNTRLVILGNMADISALLEDYTAAAEYLSLADEIAVDDPLEKQTLYISKFLCAAAQGETAVLALAQELLTLPTNRNTDHFLGGLAVQALCEATLKFHNQHYTLLGLQLLEKMSLSSDANRSQTLRRLRVEYCRAFGTPQELAQAYCDYYTVTQEVSKVTEHVRVSAMETLLSLHKQVKTLHAVHQRSNELESMAHLDDVTGLHNRRFFNRAIDQAKSNPQLRSLGFMIIDLDCFKEYNDHYGHPKGDVILHTVAQCLCQNAPKSLVISRYGGDEFACLCINCTDRQLENYIIQVRRQLAQLALEHLSSKCSNQVTLSIGYCNYPTPAAYDTDRLFDLADKALYKVKLAGRNGYARGDGGDGGVAPPPGKLAGTAPPPGKL